MAAHRYWRVYINALVSASDTGIAAVYLSTSSVVQAASGGTASADSVYDVSYAASKAFDADPQTIWATGSGTFPHWIKYDFGSGNDKDIVAFGITARNDSFATTQSPKDFKLQYSDDDSSWTDAGITVTSETTWVAAQTRFYPTASKQEWRLNCTAVESGAVSIARLDMRSSVGGASVIGNGFADSSSHYVDSPTYAADNAFDGNAATFWGAATSPPQWIRYRFPAATNVLQYVIQAPPSGNNTQTPKTWTVDYWDGSTWVTADTQTSVANWSAGETRTYTIAAATSARVSQAVVEVLRTNTAVKARVSQAVVEALRINLGVNLQVSQASLEVLRTIAAPQLQVSQAALEILRVNGASTPLSTDVPLHIIVAT